MREYGLTSNVSTRMANEELIRRGVIIRPGFLWGLGNWIRVTSGTMEHTEIFLEKLDEIIKL